MNGNWPEVAPGVHVGPQGEEPPMPLPTTKTAKRTFVPGRGYVLVEPRPLEFRHANGPAGTPGNVPFVRPQAKPLSRKARRRRGIQD